MVREFGALCGGVVVMVNAVVRVVVSVVVVVVVIGCSGVIVMLMVWCGVVRLGIWYRLKWEK